MSIFVTGDCHGEFSRFTPALFPEGKELARSDYVIVCGDFGLWHDTYDERAWFDMLEERPFTIVFVDGNHSNFDRLYSDEFEEVDFCGGKAHKIRENIYHLERGYVFTIGGKKFFCFGGASSHDMRDGVINKDDSLSEKEAIDVATQWYMEGKQYRINHLSWWKQELPSQEEMDRGIAELTKNDFKVDYIISHCAPQMVASVFSRGVYQADVLTNYFNGLLERGLDFNRWFFGHYHGERVVMGKYQMLYERIEQIL